MLMNDSLEAANERETGFSDSRLQQFWDPDRLFGKLLSQTLNLKASIAWDIYLVYPPNTIWDAELHLRHNFGCIS